MLLFYGNVKKQTNHIAVLVHFTSSTVTYVSLKHGIDILADFHPRHIMMCQEEILYVRNAEDLIIIYIYVERGNVEHTSRVNSVTGAKTHVNKQL